MEQILLDNINRAIKPAVKVILDSVKSIKIQQKEYDVKINAIKAEEKVLKQKDEEREKTLVQALDETAMRYAEADHLQRELQVQYSGNLNLSSDLEKKIVEVTNTLRDAKLERKLAVDERERTTTKKHAVTAKLALLQNDENKLSARAQALNDRDSKIKVKESVLLAQEEKNAQIVQEFEERESELKLKEKKIEIELRRVENARPKK